MRILVAGAADWTHPMLVRVALSCYGPGTVVHGGAPGAEAVAADLAARMGWPVEAHPLEGRASFAARARREQLLVERGADVCLAFPLLRSREVWERVRAARGAGIPVVVPAAVWQLHRAQESVGLAVFTGVVVEATPTVRWAIGRGWPEVLAELAAAGWHGRPLGPPVPR